MKHFFYIALILLSLQGFTQDFTPEQQHEIDSLYQISQDETQHDTTIVYAYLKLSEILYVSDLDTMLFLCTKGKSIAQEGINNKQYNSKEKEVLLAYLSDCLNNIGYVYKYKGEIPKALEYYHQSLKISEKLDNIKSQSMTLNNIGSTYYQQNDIKLALDYYQRSLALKRELKDSLGMAYTINNLGVIYYYKELEGNKDSLKALALEYLFESLAIREALGDLAIIAGSINNIGVVYKDLKNYPKALEYLKRSLNIRTELGDKKGMVANLINISIVHKDQNNISQAEEYGIKALATSKEIGYPDLIKNAALNLYEVYEVTDKFKPALENYKLHIEMRDSLNNSENQKAAAQQQAKYEYETQKAIDDAEHDKQLAIKQKSKEKQQVLTITTAIGLALVVVFLLFIFNRLKITRRQKEVIEYAHSELEEKNKEITDSIQYAKRIQNAILPANKVVKEYLPDSFILYKPKDIVAGDFYWMEHRDGKILFAAADCTGHGVPGAMVSVVCNNGLNRSVREHGLTDPGKVLDKTREIVVAEFEKSEQEVQDGMDIALCSLDGTTLQYAGAHNPLWVIRDSEVLETKADKQPIGKFYNPLPYTTHTIELLKGDSIYIFSDGYVDQFGGEKGKKFKSKAFKDLLLSIQGNDMQQQRERIDKAFEDWKGSLEQIDDVCVIGVRV